MKTIFVSAAAATLVGCTCTMPPQFLTSGCTDAFACLDRTTAMPPIEPTPGVARHAPVDTKAATRTSKASAQSGSKSEPKNNARAATAADPENKASTRYGGFIIDHADTSSDPVINKAKAAVSAKMEEDPSSIELIGVKRGIRKNELGVPLDTICGYVKRKAALGNGADQKPFLYLVKENEAYVVRGSDEVPAGAAYHNICN